MARRDERGVRLLTRNGYDFADRFPLITKAVAALPVRSCFIDGEAIVVYSDGLSVFDLLRYRQHDSAAVLCAFDLIELDDEDIRNAPIEQRKDLLADLLRRVERSHCGMTLNESYQGPALQSTSMPAGLVARGLYRSGSPYRSGRVDNWLEIKNSASPAVKREAEEDWGNQRWARGREGTPKVCRWALLPIYHARGAREWRCAFPLAAMFSRRQICFARGGGDRGAERVS